MAWQVWRYRLALLISIGVIVPIGYSGRFYLSPDLEWLRNWIGNLAYDCFWVFLTLLVWPQISPLHAAIGVCLASFGIEFLQLWQPPWLQASRATLWLFPTFGDQGVESALEPRSLVAPTRDRISLHQKLGRAKHS